MKRNIGTVFFILVLSTIYFGIQLFNNDSLNRVDYLHNYHDKVLNYQYVDVLNTEITEDKEPFYQDLENLAIKYRVSVYAGATLPSPTTGKLISYNYVSSSDIFLKDSVLVQQGYFQSDEDIDYSSLASDPKKKLSTIFSTDEFYLQNLRDKEMFGGPYFFKPHVAGNMEVIDQLLDELNQLYPKFEYMQYKDYPYLGAYYDTNKYLKEIGMISCLLVLILCSVLFSKLREIGIRKMEGYSSLSIYIDYFEKPFLLYGVICYGLLFGLSFLIYSQSTLSMQALFTCLSGQYIRFIIIFQGISVVLYTLIALSPISISIKGKNNLSELQVLVYVLKLGVSFLIIPAMIVGYSAILDTMIIVKNHNVSKDQLTDLYTFSSRYSSTYFEFGNKMNDDLVDAVSQEFREYNDMFTLLGAFVENVNDKSKLLPFYIVDEGYIIQRELLTEEELTELDEAIFIKESSKISEKMLETYRKSLEASSEQTIPIIRYDQNLITYNAKQLLYSPYLGDEILVYRKSSEAERIDGLMFKYKGDDVQGYVDSVFVKNRFEPSFMIEKVASGYESLYQYRLNWHSKTIIPLIAMGLSYLLITKLILEIDIAANKKRYFLRKVEGYAGVSAKAYFIKIGSPILVAFILLRVMGKIYLTPLSYTILGISIVVECIIFLVYQIVYHRKVRN